MPSDPGRESEIKSIELKPAITETSMLRVTNNSLHDIFYKGTPPNNILFKIRIWNQSSNHWHYLEEVKEPLKMSFRLLRSSESVVLGSPLVLAEYKCTKLEVGLFIKWNPNEKKLSLNSNDGPQPTESGWTYFSLPSASQTNS